MTQSMGIGIIKSNILANNSQITLSNPSNNFDKFEIEFKKIDLKNKKINLITTTNNINAIKNANIVFLCVKPDVIPIVLTQLKSHWKGMIFFNILAQNNN